MKVLVTGASGFVGSALCRSLAAGPFQVVGQVRSLCNPVTGVEYVRAELKESTKLDAALRGVECVVHLAGRAHIFGRQRDSLDIFRKVNRDATLALARQAIEASVKRFIFVSSIGVNGALTKEKPFDENSKPAPHAEYAISKFEAEVALRELFKPVLSRTCYRQASTRLRLECSWKFLAIVEAGCFGTSLFHLVA
ncbi:NAD-dependent epimerase/dehydratase family protein [Pseudomonas aeruginosa]|nr:NAD-dependent epimerase/dehydratase family protein [Pseudomonas aeruginosa]